MNILIVGAGKVGSTLAAYLSREDHNVTIIDQNDTAIHRASDTLDVMCIKGPGAAPSVLREAGVEDADLVLATTNLDEVNMLCALTRKRLGCQVHHLPGIRDLAYSDDLPAPQKDLNIDAVINPEYATALEISRRSASQPQPTWTPSSGERWRCWAFVCRRETLWWGFLCPTFSVGPAVCRSSSPPQSGRER